MKGRLRPLYPDLGLYNSCIISRLREKVLHLSVSGAPGERLSDGEACVAMEAKLSSSASFFTSVFLVPPSLCQVNLFKMSICSAKGIVMPFPVITAERRREMTRAAPSKWSSLLLSLMSLFKVAMWNVIGLQSHRNRQEKVNYLLNTD